MEVSYSIMAHPSRKWMVEYLLNKLGEINVFYDEGKGLWDTSKRAWLSFDKNSDYHFVLQDDVIPCDSFFKKVELFLNKHKPKAVQLYLGRKPNRDYTRHLKKGYCSKQHLLHGVAIGIKTSLIPEMINFCDKMSKSQDDMRIRAFLNSKKIMTLYPMPSLVNHRQDKSLVGDGGEMRIAQYFEDNMEPKIPKIIHQIWLGEKRKPIEWLNTWKEKHPNYKYILWDEKRIKKLKLVNKDIFEKFKKAKCYHGMSNILRIEILKKYGGIYLDADMSCRKPINEKWLNQDFVIVRSPNIKDLLCNAVLMCPKDSPLLDKYIEYLKGVDNPFPSWKKTGSNVLTPIFYKNPKGLLILQSWTFFPTSMRGKKHKHFEKAYADHYWGTTRRVYD